MQHNYYFLNRILGFVLLLGLTLPLLAQSNDCTLSGGRLISPNDTRYIPVCLDDMDEGLTDIIRTDFSGGTSQYFLTNPAGFIIQRLEGDPPFDFRNLGTGVFVVWSVAYSGDLVDVAAGDNICAAGATECFSLSNSVIVNRKQGDDCADFCVVSAGSLTLTDGGTETSICISEGVGPTVAVTQTEVPRGPNQTFVITNNANEILAIPEDAGPFDLSGAGAGTCLIWYLSYEDDLTGLAVGNTPDDFDGCFNFSNPLTVNRSAVDGGLLAFEDGSDAISICAGDGTPDLVDVSLTNEVGTNTTYVITDTTGVILDIPAAGPPFDFEGAGAGVCLIWHLSFEDGLLGAVVDSNATNLSGCFDLSNPIQVTRETPNGGSLSLPGGGVDTAICISGGSGPQVSVVLSDDVVGANQSFVITSDADSILALPMGSGPFDLSGAGAGTCRIYHIAYADGLTGLGTGNALDQLSGCFSLSNAVSVSRTVVDGGLLAFDVPDSPDSLSICVKDSIPDTLNVVLMDTIGTNFTYVITDTAGVILDIPANQPFIFDSVEAGVCLLWALSFEDGLIGAVIDSNANNLVGCFDLSNPLTIIRNTGDDCTGSKASSNANRPGAAAQVKVFPNPFISGITLDLTDLRDTNTELQILDPNGRVLMNRRLTMVSGQVTIPIDNISPGTYFLRLVNKGGTTTRRIIKQ